jgi:hypothetical protein
MIWNRHQRAIAHLKRAQPSIGIGAGVMSRMTRRQGIYQDLLWAENGGFDGVPFGPFSDLGFRPLPRPFYRSTWDNYSPASSLR